MEQGNMSIGWLALSGLGVAVLVMGIAWVVSVIRRDASVADIFWGISTAAVAAVYGALTPAPAPRAVLVIVLVLVWAARLSLYVLWRNHGRPEDRRYRDMRARHDPGFWWKSAYIVFGLQAVLAVLMSLPVLGAVHSTTPLNWLDAAGATLWFVGMYFETVSDHQLVRYLARPDHEHTVMDQGLWRYSRHPNYFGEACVWWGLWLIAGAAGAWWTAIGPALLTFFLLRISGVALTEKDITRRRPGYLAYVRRTNAFFPGPARTESFDDQH
jgi:steroid 5-alpha reductase family enzyme